MPFTKAQRLKGLKKQLKNLGFDVVSSSGETASSPAVGVEDHEDEEGKQLLDNWNAKDEGW